MPDSDNSLNIVIRTQADLAGAKAVEAQLERDIAKARELGQSYHASEIQLQSLREAIVQHQETNPPPLEINHGEISQPRAETPGGLPAVLLGIIQAAIRAAQQALGSSARSSETPRPVVGKERANQDGTDSSSMPSSRPGAASPRNSTNSPAIDGTGKTTSSPAQSDGTLIISDRSRSDNPLLPQNGPPGEGASTNGSSSLDGGEELSLTLAAQSQSLQSSGERLRAAVEQNTFMTNSLFLRTLDLIDSQNRKLGDVDRKISELGNQIKSLKNP